MKQSKGYLYEVVSVVFLHHVLKERPKTIKQELALGKFSLW